MQDLGIESILRVLPGIILGLTFHEYAHTLVALRLGDDTAQQAGRLTLNPLKHIDPIGFIFLLVAGFGWAKPVLIDPSKLRHPRRDDILIALAGPVSNLLFAVFIALLLKMTLSLFPYAGEPLYQEILTVGIAALYVNLGLFIFNLLPLPPLDGSHLIVNLIPAKSLAMAQIFFKYGAYVFLAIIVLERVAHINLLPIGILVDFIAKRMFGLLGLFQS
ncbi:MAG: site-2 protease family protein [Ignavibacteriales bacterium]|nr:site-2 protease family protein [Ignavibacteriales bacterium]